MDLVKWPQKSETKFKAEAQVVAWAAFAGEFPNTDNSKFVAEVRVDKKKKLRPEIFFKA